MTQTHVTHFAKNDSGSCLRFSYSGYDDNIFTLFSQAIAQDTSLKLKDKNKADSILKKSESWQIMTTLRKMIAPYSSSSSGASQSAYPYASFQGGSSEPVLFNANVNRLSGSVQITS